MNKQEGGDRRGEGGKGGKGGKGGGNLKDSAQPINGGEHKSQNNSKDLFNKKL